MCQDISLDKDKVKVCLLSSGNLYEKFSLNGFQRWKRCKVIDVCSVFALRFNSVPVFSQARWPEAGPWYAGISLSWIQFKSC